MADVATLSVLLRLKDEMSASLKGAEARMRNFGQRAGEAGRGLLMLSAPIAALGGLSIKAFADFESSFAGVRKTVDASEAEFAALAAGFRAMAKEIPISVNELNRIAEMAGQLGVGIADIEDFTATMAALGVTTTLSADEAATALARLANITSLPLNQVDRLGATIVELGNNLATTETEIVDFGLRIAGAGSIAGLTEAQILAIGGAMSSVGVQAEAGGTAVQKVLLSMTEQVATTGDQLATFAVVAGMSAEQFATAFREDAAGAFTAFVEGLGTAGTDAFGILEELGLQDQRLIRSFLSLSGAGDLLRRSMEMGTEAFAENTALTIEAEKRYATFASQVTLMRSQLNEVAITIGEALVPKLSELLKALVPVIEGIQMYVSEHPSFVKWTAIIAAGLVVLATTLVGVGLVIPALLAGVGLLTMAFGALWVAITGPVGLVILAIAGLTAAFFIWRDQMPAVFEFVGHVFAKAVNLYIDYINLLISGLNKLPGVSISALGHVAFEWRGVGEAVERAGDKVIQKIKDLMPSMRQFTDETNAATLAAAEFKHDIGEMPAVLATAKTATDDLTDSLAAFSSQAESRAFSTLAKDLSIVTEGTDDYNRRLVELILSQDAAAKAEADRLAAIRFFAAEQPNILQAFRDNLLTGDELVGMWERMSSVIKDAARETTGAASALDKVKTAMEGVQISWAGMDRLMGGTMGAYIRELVEVGKAKVLEGVEVWSDWLAKAGKTGQNIDLSRLLAALKAAGLPVGGKAGFMVPAFAGGGVVGGPVGSPQLIMAHGGEAVVPRGGGTVIINTAINGPVFGEQDLEDKVAQIWRDVARAGGFRGLIA